MLQIHPTKRENAVQNLNSISFNTWAVTENPNLRVSVISLACKKIEQLNFRCSILFPN